MIIIKHPSMHVLFSYLGLLAILFALAPISTHGQYASGITLPDTSIPPVKDITDWSYKLSTTIHTKDLKKHLYTLASDEYEGRETGTPGNDKAAAYISDVFQKLRLPQVGPDGGFSQKVAFTFLSWQQLKLSTEDNDYRNLRDFIAFPQYSNNLVVNAGEMVFAGYGIDDVNYSDYQSIDVTGKIVLVYDSEPLDPEGLSLITGSRDMSQWSHDWHLKSKAAAKYGAQGLLIISNNIKELINDNRSALINRITLIGEHKVPQDETNTIFISPDLAKDVLGHQVNHIIAMRDRLTAEKTPMQALILDNTINIHQSIDKQELLGQNLLGYIEGSDLKEELIVVSAHYDHVGTKGSSVYNGADDNASGTTTVLEIAEALQLSKLMKHGPRRSVLCLLMTGEEKGLLGSEYYVENPVFALENTVADVNIDMVGRWGADYQGTNTPYNYVIGSDRLSTDLHHINEAMNQKYSQLIINYKYNDEADPNRFYYRSDHFNFAQKGIPAIFFFNGVHDDYHRHTDTPDKIDYDLLELRARQIFHTIWELANRDVRINVNHHLTQQ